MSPQPPKTPEAVKKVARLLAQNPGYAFCDDCLAQRLSMDRDLAWSAAIELGESEDFEVDVGVCSQCLDQIEKVAHVRWHHTEEKPDAPKRPRIRFTAAMALEEDEGSPDAEPGAEPTN